MVVWTGSDRLIREGLGAYVRPGIVCPDQPNSVIFADGGAPRYPIMKPIKQNPHTAVNSHQ